MRNAKRVAMIVVASISMISWGGVAKADSCHLPKPSCTVYYTVCGVAAEADLQCID